MMRFGGHEAPSAGADGAFFVAATRMAISLLADRDQIVAAFDVDPAAGHGRRAVV
jgi:hypothetical protein